MKKILPPQVNKVLCMLHEAGFEAYIVGGCVRDMVMGKEPADYDVATSAMPWHTKEVFKDFKSFDTGIAHGTVTVIVEGQPFEITTYRTETGYSDGRHPDRVAFASGLREDAARRDFTVNSLAFNREEGLIDFFDGLADIERGILRCVGEPAQRFGEDSLRIMRALRFASVLGFDIEEETFEAAYKSRGGLARISVERIRDELVKFLCGKDVRRWLIEGVDILGAVVPELLAMKGFDQKNPHHIYDVLEHTAAAVDAVEAQPDLRLAALLHDIGKPGCFSQDENGIGHFYGHSRAGAEIAENIMRRLKFDNKTAEAVTELVRLHDVQIELSERAVKRSLNKMTPPLFFKLLKLKRADNLAQNPVYLCRQEHYDRLEKMAQDIIESRRCFSLKDLAVKGNDLLAIGVAAGPEIGEILDFLLNLVLDGRICNKKDALMEAACKFIEEKAAQKAKKY